MAKKTKKMPKRTWHCGKCGKLGHNSRTCKGKSKAKTK